MSESISRQIVSALDKVCRPGDLFTSKDVADLLGFKQASGPITGFLFKARMAGAISLDAIENNGGLRRGRYRMIDLSKVKTLAHSSRGGVKDRRVTKRRDSVEAPVVDLIPSTDESLAHVERPPIVQDDRKTDMDEFIMSLKNGGDTFYALAHRAETLLLDPDLSRVPLDRLLDEIGRRARR